MKEHTFKEKLAAYAAMATAYLAANSVEADAQIMYTDVNPDLHINQGFFNLDLNNDGITDFKLSEDGNEISTTSQFHQDEYYLMQCQGQNKLIENSQDFPYPIPCGQSIDSNNNNGNNAALRWFSITQFFGSSSSTLTFASGSGYFFPGTSNVGVKFIAGGGTHYGWARLTITNGELILKEYGYNETPDSAIAVCSNPSPCNLSSIVTVPSGQYWCSDSVIVHVLNANGMSFQWMKDGQWITGETASTFTTSQIGNYEVLISDSNCSMIYNALSLDTISISFTQHTFNSTCELPNGHANISVSNGTPSLNYLWSNGSISSSITNLSSGIYSLTISSSNSCVSDTMQITINNIGTPVDTPTISVQNDTLFSSYPGKNQWYFYSLAYALPGDTLNYYVPINNGNHFVEAIEPINGCNNFSEAFNFHFSAIPNIESPELNYSILNKTISFHLAENILLDDDIVIYNQLGQQVAATIIENQNPEIDLSLAPAGIYFYHIRSRQKYYSGKFFLGE